MATPVHRFLIVDRPLRPPLIPAVHVSGRRNDAVVDIPLVRRASPNPLRSSSLQPMTARHFKFLMLLGFALVIIFVAVTLYGYNKQTAVECSDNSSKPEQTLVSVTSAVVACVCAVGVVCAISLRRQASVRVPSGPLPPSALAPIVVVRRPSAASRNPQQAQLSEQSSDSGASATPPTAASPEAPPPYKDAVLMSSQQPPAYSDLS